MRRSFVPILGATLLLTGSVRAEMMETDVSPPDIRILGQPPADIYFRSSAGMFNAVGDLNGDGLLDLATHGPQHHEPNVSIIFGRSTWPSTWDLDVTPADVVLHESPAFRRDTSCLGSPLASQPDDLFTNLASADLTGDGIDDLIVGGACWNMVDGRGGMVLIVPGRRTWPANLDIDPGTWSPALVGPRDDGLLGGSVAVADFNGDGVLDLLTGATEAPSAVGTSAIAGRVYAVPGPIPDLRQDIEGVGYVLDGIERASRLGRVLGSGFVSPDVPHGIVLGQIQHRPSGRAVVLDGTRLEAVAGIDSTLALVKELRGPTPGDYFGHSVSLGDVDCSGWGDLLVSSTGADRPDGLSFNVGRVDLFRDVAASAGAGAPAQDLTVWGRINWIGGGYADSRMIGAACFGDLNGDGFDDIVVGQPWSDGPLGDNRDQGDVAIVWNRPDLPANVDLEEDSEWKLTISGARVGRAYGLMVDTTDLDQDGREDLLVGSFTQRAVGDYHFWPDGTLDVFTRNLHVTTVEPEAGPDQVIDLLPGSTDCSVAVRLDAGLSVDRGGDVMRHRWYEGTTLLAEGEVVTVSLAAGEHCIRLLSTSPGGWAQDRLHVTVRDLAPPEIRSITVDPSELWPPNHRMRGVHVIVDAWDACTAPEELSVRLLDATSSERSDGRGDGHASPDIEGFDVGTADFDGELRAERSGRGGGREYTLTYEVRDASGNATTGTVTVPVTHDRSGSGGRRGGTRFRSPPPGRR